MHRMKPMYMLFMRNDVPPWLMSGRGCPVTKLLTDMNMCRSACVVIIMPMPMERYAV